MCGILGGNCSKWNYQKAISDMKHRGPDGQKMIELSDFTLAFARLSIIDLSINAMQPMFTEDGAVGIVFNGEIYEYKLIRKKLIALGHCFKTFSDTEVILKAYIEWGDHFICKLDGMFAIAIYDSRVGKVKLFRDRVGVKPLYYFDKGGEFGFASELKGILNMCDNIRFEVDKSAIFDYINCLYIPEPKTMYKNIYKLKPAHYLVYNLKSKKIEKKGEYWKLKVNGLQGRQRKGAELQEELKYLVRHSVKSQMVADVPVGTFLSGGVDSSVITFHCNEQDKNVEAFTIGFAEKKYDELRFAMILSKKYNIPLNHKIFKKEDFSSLYYNLARWYDEPFADTSAFPTYKLCELAKEKVIVALTGDGGDEVFGGYPRYELMKEWNLHKRYNNVFLSKIFESIPYISDDPVLREFFCEEVNLLISTFHHEVEPDKKKVRKQLGIPHDYDECWFLRRHYHEDLPPITRGQYMDFKTYLPGDILTKVDRASMAVSLETRVPFLSKEIIEFSFGLSQEDRCPKGELKGLLKQTYLNEIGKELLYRKKKGFAIPQRFIKNEISPQEIFLKDIWKMPVMNIP